MVGIEDIDNKAKNQRRIPQPKYSELIKFIDETIKKHTDYMELIKKITGHDIEYSKGSIDAYSSVLAFISGEETI